MPSPPSLFSSASMLAVAPFTMSKLLLTDTTARRRRGSRYSKRNLRSRDPPPGRDDEILLDMGKITKLDYLEQDTKYRRVFAPSSQNSIAGHSAAQAHNEGVSCVRRI